MRALAVVWQGALAAVVTLIDRDDHVRVALDVLAWAEQQVSPLLFWRVAARIVVRAAAEGKPLYAWADDDGRLLASLGFVPVDGEVWRHDGV